MNQPYYVYLAILFTFFLKNSFAQNCTGYDISLKNVMITNISPSSINYEFELENTGSEPLTVNDLVIQNYLSKNNAYDATDAAAGGALLGYTGVSELLPSETISHVFSANITGNLKDQPFLIVTVSYKETECNTLNNQKIICTGPDMVVKEVEATNHTPTAFTFNYTFQNIGLDTAILKNFAIQTWVSKNNTFELTDTPSGGRLLSITETSYLLPNESISETFTVLNPSFENFDYLIVQAKPMNNSLDCNLENNYWAIPTRVASSFLPDEASRRKLIWNRENKSIRLTSGDALQWNFQLYSLSGSKIQFGQIHNKENSTLNISESGVYILHLSNGREIITEKIIY